MTDRRSFLTLLPAAALLGGAAAPEAAPPPSDVNATEDLMREHGVLRRILILFGQWIPGEANAAPRPAAEPLIAALHIVEKFVHGYHEKLEEEQVFPVMQKRGLQTANVKVLLEQHQAGRKVTADALALLKAAQPDWSAIAERLGSFRRMYQPHAAREDTEVFPAFHALFNEKQFDELSDKFEELEHKLLAGGSFETVLLEVQQLEKAVGIADLAIFTPR